MGRHNGESAVAQHSSSIALLQERFRQLQRVKEMREERELLRFFSESDRVFSSPTTTTTTTRYEPSRLFFHPELITIPSTPSAPPTQASFSFLPEPQNKYAPYQTADTPLLMSLWPTDRNIVRRTNSLDDTEVDTSLHL